MKPKNPAAVALGKLNKGGKKTITAKDRRRRVLQMKRLNSAKRKTI